MPLSPPSRLAITKVKLIFSNFDVWSLNICLHISILVDNWTKLRVRLHGTFQRSFAILGVNLTCLKRSCRCCPGFSRKLYDWKWKTSGVVILWLHFLFQYVLRFRIHPVPKMCFFSGAFAKLRKATVSFVTSVRLSVRLEQLGSYGADFHEILYLRIKKICRKKSMFDYNLTRITGTSPQEICKFMKISRWILPSMREKLYSDNQNTYLI
jgi:hypothetical protein